MNNQMKYNFMIASITTQTKKIRITVMRAKRRVPQKKSF